MLIVAGLLASCGGSGSPARPEMSVFGVVGSSLARWAIVGYNSIGGSRGWSNEAVAEYGGGGIMAWLDGIGSPSSRYWTLFRVGLEREPDTDQIWWQIAVAQRNDPPPVALLPSDQQAVLRVAEEIRAIAGQGMVMFVSPMPEFSEATGCSVPGSAGVELAQLMTDFAVSQGVALRGPDMQRITTQNYNGPQDPCHQGEAGRVQHGQALLDFFGG